MNKKITFKNAQGQELVGKIDLPLGNQPNHYAIFAHCFTCTKNLSAVKNISKALTQNNIAVLRFDFTGLGESDGDFSETNFSSNVEDLEAAFDFLKEQYQAPSIMMGHSLGGTATLLAAARLDDVKAVVTIGSPYEPDHVKKLFKNLEEIDAKGVADVNIGGRPFKIKKQFVDDLASVSMKAVIYNLEKSLLILHSPQDTIVGIENAADIYDAALHPKSFISLDGADHLLSNKIDSLYVGNIIASWADRYLPKNEGIDSDEDFSVQAETGADSFLTNIKAGRHRLIADEPESAGGSDLGPNPYELLLAGLGACTGMTLQMYAKRKEWPLESVDVSLKHDKIHAKDCKDCEEKTGKIDQITREIKITGDLSAEQREKLLEIADKCPVHRTLEGEIKVVTELA